jgi:hypothetical protein
MRVLKDNSKEIDVRANTTRSSVTGRHLDVIPPKLKPIFYKILEDTRIKEIDSLERS